MAAMIRFVVALFTLAGLLLPAATPGMAQIVPPEVEQSSFQPGAGFSCQAVSEIPLAECQALVSLYHQTGGPGWLNRANWLENDLPSSWYGVRVRGGHVVALQLAHNGLRGAIPPALAELPALRYVELDGNDLSGKLPAPLARLDGLESPGYPALEEASSALVAIPQPERSASLSPKMAPLPAYTPPDPKVVAATQAQVKAFDCGTVSEIPAGECQALVALYNSTNGAGWTNSTNWLANTTPSTWYGVTVSGGHVTVINMGWDNNLFGALPAQLGDLTFLTNLVLTGNYEGLQNSPIPSELGNLTNLQQLSLNGNWHNGGIPASLGSLTNLTDFDLAQNWLTGTLPSELGNLINLTLFSVGSNQLGGSIPAWLGSLTKLTRIYMDNNSFSGSLPTVLGNLSNLYTLNLSNNQLSGTLPSEYGNLSGLHYFYLTGNQLTGSLPDSWAALTKLEDFWLGNNQLSGTLPAWLGNFTILQQLWLNDNQFDGAIPPELGNLTGILRLQLGHNQLSGAVPESFTNLTNLCLPGSGWPCWDSYGLDLGYNRLSTSGLSPALDSFLAVKDPDWKDTQWTPWTSCAEVTQIPTTECEALVALYNATNGANWNSNDGWLESGKPGTWYGVTVSGGHVTKIDLHNNWLVGSLPAELGNLSGLQDLYIYNNYYLGGTIPPELGNLSNLRTLYLGSNGLEGAIPPLLGNLSNLQHLGLWGNQLSGTIPVELSALNNLVSLQLQGNNFSGSIPAWLGGMTNLEGLYLSYNDFSGAIPPELGNMTSLKYLFLSGNQLSGAIPAQLGALGNLLSLGLGYNNFSEIPAWLGSMTGLQGLGLDGLGLSALPSELGNLTSLEWLNLGDNQFSGTVPAWIGSLTNLSELYLYHNQFSGAIPSWIGSLTNLQWLGLSYNQFSGDVPESFTSLVNLYVSPGYTGLDLGYNRLNVSGLSPTLESFLAVKDPDWKDTQWTPWTSCANVNGIPPAECDALVAFYNATGGASWYSNDNWFETGTPAMWYGVGVSGGHVTSLDCWYNNLSGSLPAQIGSLPMLQSLYISDNYGMTGALPTELGNLSNLVYLYLSYNNFTGALPASLGNLSSLSYAYLQGNRFSGAIPAELSALTNLSDLNLSYNNFSEIPAWLGGMTNLQGLGLAGNGFSVLPSELGSLTNLDWLDLGSNQFSGAIPAWIGNLTNMAGLYLYNNQFSGAIPAEIGNLTNLEWLDLSMNQLSGDVPASFTNLVSLFVHPQGYTGLDLGYNRLNVPATPQALADFLDVKDPDWYLTQAVGAPVTPAGGGSFASRDGRSTFVFPPGAVPAPITVTYVPRPYLTRSIPEELADTYYAFALEVSSKADYTFSAPYSVTISYEDWMLTYRYDLVGGPFDIPEDSLMLAYWNGSAWVDAASTCAAPAAYVRNLAQNKLTVAVCKSGEFALLGEREFSISLPMIAR